MAQQFTAALVGVPTDAISQARRWRGAKRVKLLACAACSLLGCSPARSRLDHASAEQSPARSGLASSSAEPELLESATNSPEVPNLFVAKPAVEVLFVKTLSQNLPAHVERAEARRDALPLGYPADTWIALDGHAPRLSMGRRLRLVDLLNEDEELAPGGHSLTLVRWLKGKVLAQAHRFTLETKPEGPLAMPTCLLVNPQATINGVVPARDVGVFVLPLSREVVDVDYFATRVKGSGGASHDEKAWASRGRFAAHVPLSVDLPSGDIEWSVTCRSKNENLAEIQRTVTVNREASESEIP